MEHVFYSLIFLGAAVWSVKGDSQVRWTNSNYSCCEPVIKFDQQCEITCKVNGMTIAHSKGLSSDCQHPCRRIENGCMMLGACVNADLEIVCPVKGDLVEEKGVHYHHQPCSSSATAQGNQESGGLLVLAVVIGGLLQQLMIS